MPAPLGGLAIILTAISIPITIKVLSALGIGYVTYTGLSYVVDEAIQYSISNFHQLPATTITILAKLKVDSYLTLIVSAHWVVWAIRRFNGSSFNRWNWSIPSAG